MIYLVVYSTLAIIGFYVVMMFLIRLLHQALTAIVSFWAVGDHPECLDRLADAMEPES